MNCKICDNRENNKEYTVKEMMFGSSDPFIYFQCANCQCLQIAEMPSDLSKYYPCDYYSFSHPLKQRCSNPAQSLQNIYAAFSKGFYTKINCMAGPFLKMFLRKDSHKLKKIRISKKSRILDIGCGNGNFLYALCTLGFKNLLGIDPFLKNTLEYDNGLKIVKQDVFDLSGKWDLIMFHHSFEHMPDPLDNLRAVGNLLSAQGICLIRIPTVPSYAWEHYSTNWISLDAPRHLFLHSIESIKILAQKSNLSIEAIIYDSTNLQFWGSEQYKKNIPLISARSYAVNKKNSIFNRKDIREFNKMTRNLNRLKQGDHIAVYLKKI